MINPLKKSSDDALASQGKPLLPFNKTTKNRYSVGEPRVTQSNISPREIPQLEIAPGKIFEKTSLPPLRQNGAFTHLEQKVHNGTSTISIKKKGTLEQLKEAQYNQLGNVFIGRRSISERKLRSPSPPPRKEGESPLLITRNPIYAPNEEKKNGSDPEIFSTEHCINKPLSPKRSPKLTKEPVINVNPLDHPINENVLLIQRDVKSFKKSLNAILFNENKSMEKLLNIVQDFSDEMEKKVLVNLICSIYINEVKKKKIDKLNKVIALTISKSGNEKFFCGLVKDWRMDVNEFAKNMAIEFQRNINLSFSFLPTLARVTDHELKFQSRETLFREQNFSSALCREYAGIVWRDELKRFCDNLSNKLEKMGPLKLCLLPQLIEEDLAKEDPSFKTLGFDLRQKQIQSYLNSNIKSFKEFTQSILSEIFNMKIPNEMKIMLSCRRSQIFDFLNEGKNDGKLEELSRTYISEVLILRILNPQIISVAKLDIQNPVIRNVVVNLSKIVQALGNQTPFGDENEGIIHKTFKEIYNCSIEDFRNFIDRCSISNSDKEDK